MIAMEFAQYFVQTELADLENAPPQVPRSLLLISVATKSCVYLISIIIHYKIIIIVDPMTSQYCLCSSRLP